MLSKLPSEILLLIGEWLDLVEPRSVLDLAYASKHCYSIVAVISYRILAFSTDLTRLQEDVEGYYKLLKRVNGHGRVSRLVISNRLPHQAQQREEWHRLKMSSAEYNGSDLDIFKEQERIYAKQPVRDSASLDMLYKEDHLWKPLATFIEHLPALTSVFYNNWNQFPPSLFESINNYTPGCALYLTNFFLSSLGADGTDDYEFRLSTSPCLRGIISQYEDTNGYDSYGRITYHTQALQSLIHGLTPNLKEFYVYHRPHRINEEEPLQPRDDWNYFRMNCHGNSTQSHSGGSLENFGLSYYGLYPEEFEWWIESVNLSKLKALRLSELTLEVNSMQYLASCRFPSLQELDINLFINTSRQAMDDFKSAANHFLLNLPPLTHLHLLRWDPKVCAGLISEKFGSRLRRLSITPAFNISIPLQDIQSLAEVCQLVEELTIEISRTRGDSQEVAHYRLLGSFPRLRRLFLSLSPSGHVLTRGTRHDAGAAHEDHHNNVFEPRNDPTFNEFDQQHVETTYGNGCLIPRNGHIRDAMINSALDGQLASDIFTAINPRDGPLEFMQVQISMGMEICRRVGGVDLITILHRISPQCTVTRICGDELNLKVLVDSGDREPPPLHPDLQPWLMPIFNRVWPAKIGNWYEDWHSFPLATSPDKEIDWKSG